MSQGSLTSKVELNASLGLKRKFIHGEVRRNVGVSLPTQDNKIVIPEGKLDFVFFKQFNTDTPTSRLESMLVGLILWNANW